MRPLRCSINVTLDGCCDHRAIPPDEELHRHAVENLERADALLFGRVTYEMMEAAWRPPAQAGGRPDWMEPFARTIDAAKKYAVSSTLERVDWNAELLRGDLYKTVQQLKNEPAGVDRAGIDRRVRVRRAPEAGRPWADVVRGTVEACRLEAREPAGVSVGGGGGWGWGRAARGHPPPPRPGRRATP